MPTHLHMTYFQTNKAGMMVLGGAVLFWIAVYIGCIYACVTHNPVVHENETALILAVIVVVIGGLGQAAFALGALFYCWRYRLDFDEHGITCRGMFSETTIDLTEVTQLQWKYLKNRMKFRIDLLTPTSKVTMTLELLKKQPVHRNSLICYLRETIPHERQTGWEKFRRHIELTRQSWHVDGKNHVPVVAEDEFLVTRKHLNRCLPWLIWPGVVLGGIAYFRALPAILVVWSPTILWWALYLTWPKHGRVWKKSLQRPLTQAGKYYISLIVMLEIMLLLMVFGHPILLCVSQIQTIACYVLFFALLRTIMKLGSEPNIDLPENDIPDVLRSVSKVQ